MLSLCINCCWCNNYCPLYWITFFDLLIASYVALMTLTRQQHW